ncbi:unnamed protein product [Closterium sp. NIES-53]
MVQYRPTRANTLKFKHRARWGVHLGISFEHIAWNILDHDTSLVVAARDVIFYEDLAIQTFQSDRYANRLRVGGQTDRVARYERPPRSFATPTDEAAAALADQDPPDPLLGPRPWRDKDHEEENAPIDSSCDSLLSPTPSSAHDSDDDVVEVTSEQQHSHGLSGLQILGLHRGVSRSPKAVELKTPTAMASLCVLAFDHEGRPIQFDTWLDDLQLYLLSNSRNSVSLFDHTSGATPAPPTTADSATRSQWHTCDPAACLSIRNHLPLAKCAHFEQHRTAQAMYGDVVARYSSPATTALGRLLMPYLFLELSAFATVEDLVSHLRASDAHYHAATPAEFLDRNQPPMYITLYFIVTRLPDSLHAIRDHFLALDPTALTVDLLEQHLLAAETSVVADAGAASTSAKCRSGKGKGGRGGGGCSGSGGGGSSGGTGGSGGGDNGGSGGGSGGVGGGGGGSGGSGGSGSGGGGGGRTGAQSGGSGGGQRQRQQRRSETPSPQQLREWLFQCGASGGSVICSYIICMGDRAGQTCGKPHTQHHCFSALKTLGMLSLVMRSSTPTGHSCLGLDCVPPDPGIEASALGASDSSLPSTAPAKAWHTFTQDSGTSRCFFCDSTTLTPLPAPFLVRLADPSGGSVVARSSTVLPCLAVPSGSLSGLYLPSFSTNLVSTAALQNLMVTTTTPRGQRVSIFTCTRTGRHLATFIGRVCTYWLPSLLRSHPLARVASCRTRLSSGTTALDTPPCHACVACSPASLSLVFPSLCLPSRPPQPLPAFLALRGGSRAPSSFPPTTTPLQTLHMDMWGPACVSGHGRDRYFLLVVDDYTRYTSVFPLRSKGQVVDVLIPWIRAVRLQLRERFRVDLLVLRLHSDRGGEFSSDLLRDFCRGEGILELFTLPDSPQQNGIAERRIGLVMEVARTSMIHAAAPHFLWPFAVRYAAHQLNLWPRVSLRETSPILHWTGKFGDASVFRVWGSRAFVRDTSADKLSAHAIPCVFLCFSPDAPCLQFYHPTLRRVFPSQDVTFEESVPFYCLFPYRSAPPPPPPLILAPGPPPVDPLPPQGLAPSGVYQVDPLPSTVPVVVAGDSGAAQCSASRGAEPGGAEPGGIEPGGAECEGAGSRGVELGAAEPGGSEPGGAEPERVEPGGAESGGAESRSAASFGGPNGTLPRPSPRQEPLSLQQLCELLVWRARPRGGAAGAPVDRDTGAGGASVTAGAGGTRVTASAGPRGARTRGTGAAEAGGVGGAGAGDLTEPRVARVGGTAAGGTGAGAGGAGAGGSGEGGAAAGGAEDVEFGAGGAGAGGTGGTGAGGTVRSRPYFFPLLQQVPDPQSDHARAASPTVSHLLATAVTDPSFESAAASALVAELLEFAATCRLDYATALVAESESVSPPSVGGGCALGTDVLEDRQEDFEYLAGAVPCFASMLLAPKGDLDVPEILTPRSYVASKGPYSSQWQAAMDAEMASWKSTGTYVDAVPPSRENIVDGMWIFRFRDPSWLGTVWHCSTSLTTLAALGFAPSTADPSLFLRTNTSFPPFYVLVHVDDLIFATADTEALTLVKSELQKRHTCTDLGELRSYLGLQITRNRARRTITLTQSHIVHQVLQRFGFQFSSPQPTPLSTSHSLSAPPSDESVEPSGPYPELVGCLMYLMTCTRPYLAYLLSLLARYVAPGRHRKVHWDAAKRVLRYLCSTSGMGLVLGGRGPVVLTGHADASWVEDAAIQRSSCEAEIYAGAMAAQELRWLTDLMTDLGEQPRSPPVLYVDNKTMIALCQEHRVEYRTKHIALQYFLARELQHRGQLRLSYVATRANTADIFTKALPLGDHQRFSIVLGLVPTLPHLLSA